MKIIIIFKKKHLPEGCGVNVSDALRFDELDFHLQQLLHLFYCPFQYVGTFDTTLTNVDTAVVPDFQSRYVDDSPLLLIKVTIMNTQNKSGVNRH